MLKVAITGGIGSGKTSVAEIFKILGIHVYNADLQAKLFLTHEYVKNEIKQYFGKTIFDSHNEINRKQLATIVFKDKQALTRLNSIIHPLVKDDFDKWLMQFKNEPYIIHEAAILFETGFYKLFDKTILVTSTREFCIRRVMQRDNLTEQAVTERMLSQWDDSRKTELADYIIKNDEQHLIIPQVLDLHQKFTG